MIAVLTFQSLNVQAERSRLALLAALIAG